MEGTAGSKTRQAVSFREPLFDNLRAILIILVVAGHLFEAGLGDPIVRKAWELIYVFHMPAFMFVSGRFSRFDPEAMLKKLVVPYLVFQTLYIAFFNFVAHTYDSPALQFSEPIYLTWYLMSLLFLRASVPFLELAKTHGQRIAVVVGLIALALIAPFDEKVGRLFSAARTFSFAPFFAAGFYSVEEGKQGPLKDKAVMGATAAVILLCCYQLIVSGYGASALRGVATYGEQMSVLRKARLLVHGIAWTGVLVNVTPAKELPMLGSIGSNTMPVFLLHGFVTNYLYGMGLSGIPTMLFLSLTTTGAVFLAVILSRGPARAVTNVLCLEWLTERTEKKPIEKAGAGR